MALKILATGDIHIGRQSSEVPIGAEESASKFVWNKIIDLVIEKDIDLVLLSGDIVDQNNRYFEAIGPLVSGFERLKKADIALYMVAGNHDHHVLPQLINSEKYPNIHLLGENGEWEVKTFSKNGNSIQIVGWSFPQQYIYEDPTKNFDNSLLDRNLPTIGLLHGDIDNIGSSYAPIDITSLSNKPVDAWVLGHIHKPQRLRKDSPLIFYPGSPQALSSKEQGIHGPVLMLVESKQNIKPEWIPLSPVRYEELAIDITDVKDEVALRSVVTADIFEDANKRKAELQDVLYLIYDVVLVGEHNSVRDLQTWTSRIIEDYSLEIPQTQTRLSVRKVSVNVSPKVENLQELARQSSPAGILASAIIALENGETTDFLSQVFPELNRETDSIYQSGTYQRLRVNEKITEMTEEKSKNLVLKECNRLLAELMNQQNIA